MALPTLKDLEKIFFPTILGNLQHIDYERVNCIAKDYTAYTTGEGIEEKLKRFHMREPEDMFKQRCELTKSVTPDISNSIMNPMFKIGRTPASTSLSWGGNENSENKKKLADAAKSFNGEDSVEDYLKYRLAELDATDPNSFIVVEFEGTADANKPQSTKVISPYPYEVNSAEAVDYVYDNNILQYLMVLNCIKIYSDKGDEKDGKKYTLYIANNSVLAQQIDFTMVEKFKTDNPNFIAYTKEIQLQETVNENSYVYLYQTGEETESDRRYFVVQVYRHGINFVPAKRVGIRRDLTTRGRTCVPIMHPAQSYFEKSIKQCSEFDLTNALHVFPQKVIYAPLCAGMPAQGENPAVGCNKGLSVLGGTCGACHGTGFAIHKSAQDVVIMALPKDPKDIISLESIIAYKNPPIDLLKFQKEYGNELREHAIRAVYNSDVFTPSQISETATAKVIDLDAVYDTLQSFAKNYSSTWVLIMKSIAWLKDIGKDLVAIHQFPVDFKMKSFTALLADLSAANANQAPSHVKKAITQDITRRLYLDYPDEIVKIETKDRFFPFPGKTQAEITFIISSDLTTTENKILYANFDQIFAELEVADKDFYLKAQEVQKTAIQEKVAALIDVIETQTFDNTIIPFVPGGTVPADPAAVA